MEIESVSDRIEQLNLKIFNLRVAEQTFLALSLGSGIISLSELAEDYTTRTPAAATALSIFTLAFSRQFNSKANQLESEIGTLKAHQHLHRTQRPEEKLNPN